MALRFRIEITKGNPRVAVLRIVDQTGKQEQLELIGSFGQRNSPDLLRDKLKEDELYEFENFLAALDFSKSFFHTEADELDRFIVKVAPQFRKGLFQLWKEAKKYDLEFIPDKEMLYGLFNKAKEIERKINQLSGKKNNILEKLGIDINAVSDSTSVDHESKKLFQTILELDIPLEKIAQEFQTIAQNDYQKNTRFEPHFFNHYADPTHQKSFPKWYYSIAIDWLHQQGINPLTVISPPKVAKHWARLKVNKMSADKAKQLFSTTFKPNKKVEKKCWEMINLIYLSQQALDK